jgi:prefoldin subunit 5
MDLLTQLKTLRDTTNSPQVKTICESNIQKIQNGDKTLDPNMIIESIQNLQTQNETVMDPHQVLREQEMAKSKNVASKLMESWGGLGSTRAKTSGSYVEGAKEEATNFDSQALNESLANLADTDSSVAAFMKAQTVNNLGVFESLLSIKDTGIYEHPSVKIVCEKYLHLLKAKNLPEFLVAESFSQEMKNFTWDNKIKSLVESIDEKVGSLKAEIEVSKTLYAISQNAGSDFYSPVTESLNKWLISENKSVALLSKEISRWQFNPAVRNLLNTLSVFENNSEKLNIPIHNGNSSVRRVYSPVFVQGGKTTFSIGNNIFEGNNSGIKKLNRGQIAVLPAEFLALLESFYAPYVKIDEKGLNIFIAKNKFSLVEENEKVAVYSNGQKMKFEDKVQLSKALALEISGSFGVNENKVIFDIMNLFENFSKVVELDFAKRIESKLYEGAAVNLIKWQGKMYLNRINESMKDNSLYEVNGMQAANLVKDFLKFDISEGLTEFLEGESRVKSIMLNDRKRLMENISIVEGEILKLESKMKSNPLFAASAELQRAHNLLEKELGSLRQKWSAINEEIQKIESGIVEVNNVNEDDKFNVGEYVKVKESGNTGKIISIDGTSGSYTVLMDNGKTGDFRVDEIINLDDALATAGDENEAEAETQEELKEGTQPMAVAPGKSEMAKEDKSTEATMKKNISVAPSAKGEDKAGKKDVENLKDANLEEAPEGKETETKYKANKEAGYNLSEGNEADLAKAPEGTNSSTNMATEWEKSGIKAMNLAEAPGKAEGDAGYEVKGIEAKKSKPEVMNIDPELASAPGDQKGKDLDYKVSSEMGYNVDEAADIMKIDQEMAKAPGKAEGDADYAVKVVKAGAHNPEVMRIDPNFAVAPEKGAKAGTDLEVNSEMGYNLGEAIEYVKKNMNSEEVKKFLQEMAGVFGVEQIDESEESKKN